MKQVSLFDEPPPTMPTRAAERLQDARNAEMSPADSERTTADTAALSASERQSFAALMDYVAGATPWK